MLVFKTIPTWLLILRGGVTINGDFDVAGGSQFNAEVFVPIIIPTVFTDSVTALSCSSADAGGVVTSEGGGSVIEKGICWSTSENPTTSNSKIICGSDAGPFTGNLTGLAAGTTYYIRSYATNSAGTAYGTQASFSTSALSLPVLSATGTAYSISYTSAYSTGNITSDGGSPVTNRGFCWSNSSNPTISNFTCSAGSGTGSFAGNLTGLSPATTYYVRSFATNSVGTGYGSQTSFSTLTLQIPSPAATTAATNISATTATSGGNVTSGNGSTVTARGVCWNTSGNPTVANSKTIDGSGSGAFTSNITGLTASTSYYLDLMQPIQLEQVTGPKHHLRLRQAELRPTSRLLFSHPAQRTMLFNGL